MPPVSGARRLPQQASLDQPQGSLDTLFCLLCQYAFSLLMAVLQRELFVLSQFFVLEGNIQPLLPSLSLLTACSHPQPVQLWDFSLQVSVMATKLQLPSSTEASNSSCVLLMLCAFQGIQLAKKVKMVRVFVNQLCDQFFPFFSVSDNSYSVTGSHVPFIFDASAVYSLFWVNNRRKLNLIFKFNILK